MLLLLRPMLSGSHFHTGENLYYLFSCLVCAITTTEPQQIPFRIVIVIVDLILPPVLLPSLCMSN